MHVLLIDCTHVLVPFTAAFTAKHIENVAVIVMSPGNILFSYN